MASGKGGRTPTVVKARSASNSVLQKSIRSSKFLGEFFISLSIVCFNNCNSVTIVLERFSKYSKINILVVGI